MQRLIQPLACLLLFAACAEQPAEPSPNVLLISIDTLRQDHLGCYGHPRPTSPNLDALAARGAVFEQVFSTAPWTLPAHTSMLTGLFPSFHGLMDDGVALPAGVGTLAAGMVALGYRTLAVTSHVYVSSAFGLERGFESFDDSLTEGGTRNPDAAEAVDRFLERLDERDGLPFFGFLHVFDPHWTYAAPPPFDGRFADPSYSGTVDGRMASMQEFFHPAKRMPEADRQHAMALYDEEIAYVDAQLGRLFAQLEQRGLLRDTVILVTGDHGEEFKEHGGLGHGRTLFVEQLAVPLIVAGHPAFPPGTRRSDPASLVDVAPTLLSLAGAPRSELGAFQGRALDRESGAGRTLFAESIRFGIELRAARDDRHQVVQFGDERVYFDLASDPRAQRLLREDPTGGALSAALADYAGVADAGWHLKLIAPGAEPMTCRASISCDGKLVGVRRYVSENINGREARFDRFELSPDGRRFDLEVELRGTIGHVGELVFETEPSDAALTVSFEVEGPGDPGVFLGVGTPLDARAPVTLALDDPRLASPPPDYARARPGAYLRAVPPVGAGAARTGLSAETLEHLRGLGYVDAGD